VSPCAPSRCANAGLSRKRSWVRIPSGLLGVVLLRDIRWPSLRLAAGAIVRNDRGTEHGLDLLGAPVMVGRVQSEVEDVVLAECVGMAVQEQELRSTATAVRLLPSRNG